MKNLFDNYKINVTEETLNKLEEYYNILIEYNNYFNLTAITEKKEVYIKHFIDSLLGNELFKGGKTLIDIGSGGGFPAIPIKIYNKELEVTLVEATGKKCEFLRAVIERLKLENIKVINARAEDLANKTEFREKFDYVSARAVARLNVLSEFCLPFVKVGGNFIAYKGDVKEELIEAEKGIGIFGGKIENLLEFNLEDAKRAIVVIKKIKRTEKKYPRSNAKIRKSPL